MTILENSPEVETQAKTEVDHFLCCRIPTGAIGYFKTFCGLTIFDEATAAEEVVSCSSCMTIAYDKDKTFCPEGHLCAFGDNS